MLELGQVRSAVEQYYRILQCEPDNIEVLHILARIFATTEDATIQNPSDAVKFAQRACELTKYQRPDLLDSLAAAYAAAGRFGEAIETAEKAINLADAAGKKEIAEKIRSRVQLYKAGQPYRQKNVPAK